MRFAARRAAPALSMLALTVTMLSCDATGATAPPPVTTLDPGTWYLHRADDSVLSALIAERSVGLALEQTYVDSAWIDVDGNGAFEQRYWIHVDVSGSLDREEVVVDRGTWTGSGGTFVFASELRTRTFIVTTPAVGVINGAERLVFWAGAPTTATVYRRTPP